MINLYLFVYSTYKAQLLHVYGARFGWMTWHLVEAIAVSSNMIRLALFSTFCYATLHSNTTTYKRYEDMGSCANREMYMCIVDANVDIVFSLWQVL